MGDIREEQVGDRAILGFAELLHDREIDPASPQYLEFLQDILTSGRHLQQLSNDVLDLAQVEAGKIADEYEARDVAAHPLFVALRSQPVNLPAIWLLVANMNAGISPNFVRWLALTIARVKDYRVASLIAKQLDDELGHGEFERGDAGCRLDPRPLVGRCPAALHGARELIRRS